MPYLSTHPAPVKMYGPATYTDTSPPAEVNMLQRSEVTTHVVIRGQYQALSLCVYGAVVLPHEVEAMVSAPKPVGAPLYIGTALPNPLLKEVNPAPLRIQSVLPMPKRTNMELKHIGKAAASTEVFCDVWPYLSSS